MNRQDRGILVGMVLGDSYIRTATSVDKLAGRRIAAQMSFSHSAKQSEYAQWKLDELNRIFGGHATLSFRTANDGYELCYASKSNPYMKTLKGMMYFNGEKEIRPNVLNMLNPKGIAIWFMDDGSYRMNRKPDGNVSSVSLTISTYCPEPEIESVIEYFQSQHNVGFKKAFCKKTKSWYVRTNTENSRKFASLIHPYMIPSMRYKLSCVERLDRHECLEPDKTCLKCGKLFVALKAKGLCMKCYNDKYFRDLKHHTRICEMCNQEKSSRWFVGNRCRACYQRIKRAH